MKTANTKCFHSEPTLIPFLRPNAAPHRPRGNEWSSCRRMLALSLNDSLVLVMRSDPEPYQAIRDFDRKRTMVEANSHRTESANLFEMQRGMSRV